MIADFCLPGSLDQGSVVNQADVSFHGPQEMFPPNGPFVDACFLLFGLWKTQRTANQHAVY